MKDTWDTRVAKLRLSAHSFVQQQEAHAKVPWGGLSQTCGLGADGNAGWGLFVVSFFSLSWELKPNAEKSFYGPVAAPRAWWK